MKRRNASSKRRWQVNDTRKRAMGRKVIKAMGGDVHGKTVAVLGLTFKPNTDDMRDAPSLSIIAGAAGCRRDGARL
jgi:UDP-glucose 6-dehydrogenase